MRLNKRTAVIGCALSAPENVDAQSLEELLFDVAQAAMKDAGLEIDDIDGIVVAANDQIDGRAISVMAASGSVGGVGRDILSTPSAGEHAFVMGALRIASGLYRTHLVLAWSPTEAIEMAEVERLAADPYYHRRLPLDDLSSFALQASALAAKASGAEALARALVSQRAAPSGGPEYRRWPLTAAMTPPPRTGAVALVLASGGLCRLERPIGRLDQGHALGDGGGFSGRPRSLDGARRWRPRRASPMKTPESHRRDGRST